MQLVSKHGHKTSWKTMLHVLPPTLKLVSQLQVGSASCVNPDFLLENYRPPFGQFLIKHRLLTFLTSSSFLTRRIFSPSLALFTSVSSLSMSLDSEMASEQGAQQPNDVPHTPRVWKWFLCMLWESFSLIWSCPKNLHLFWFFSGTLVASKVLWGYFPKAFTSSLWLVLSKVRGRGVAVFLLKIISGYIVFVVKFLGERFRTD